MKENIFFIAVGITAVAFLISVFLLTRKKSPAGDDVNVYGVDKKTKKDKYYVKIYIRLIIISFVSVVISALIFLISGYMDAKKKYDAFNDKKFLEALDGNALDCSLSEFVEDNMDSHFYECIDCEQIFTDDCVRYKSGNYLLTEDKFAKKAVENLSKRLADFKKEIKSKKVMDYFNNNGTLHAYLGKLIRKSK